jgi:1-acyl-sn-glycerol-3-phosphate acyltransferase
VSLFDHRRRAPGRSWIRVLLGWTVPQSTVHLFYRVLWRFRRYESQRVPREGPLVFVSNHQSHFDPPAVSILGADRPCCFLARASLFDFKPFGALIRFLNAIPLERGGKGGAGALRHAVRELEAGRCVTLFPEGSRTSDGSVHPFKPGVMLLLRRTGATVVPVGIEGAHDIWPIGRRLPRLGGRFAIIAGDPISADELLAMETPDALKRLREESDRLRREVGERIG